jgi:hypothetical protein
VTPTASAIPAGNVAVATHAIPQRVDRDGAQRDVLHDHQVRDVQARERRTYSRNTSTIIQRSVHVDAACAGAQQDADSSGRT